VTTTRGYELRDDRVVPSLLDASAQGGSAHKLLVVRSTGSTISAQLLPLGGTRLEDANVAYRYSLASLNGSSEAFKQISELVANLAAANGPAVEAGLPSSHVSYILVANDQSSASSQLSSALDSVDSIESAGLTEFGRLWRVKVTVLAAPSPSKSPWSVTKGIQLAILVGFLLLAIPTSGSSKKRAKDSSIFIESEGDAL
jgi:hypothetical protein